MRYKPSGVCARLIEFDIEGGKIKNVRFTDGCSGNAQGISVLAEGMEVNEVIRRLENIKCGFKNTSCPSELAKALKKYQEAEMIDKLYDRV